ncbi:hypothetical protein AOLI_G00298850 [Acnodon oligacanthus]
MAFITDPGLRKTNIQFKAAAFAGFAFFLIRIQRSMFPNRSPLLRVTILAVGSETRPGGGLHPHRSLQVILQNCVGHSSSLESYAAGPCSRETFSTLENVCKEEEEEKQNHSLKRHSWSFVPNTNFYSNMTVRNDFISKALDEAGGRVKRDGCLCWQRAATAWLRNKGALWGRRRLVH